MKPLDKRTTVYHLLEDDDAPDEIVVYTRNDVKEAIEGLISELHPPNYLGDRGPFFTRNDVLRFVEKWFPDLN
jgi:hypothetical protein